MDTEILLEQAEIDEAWRTVLREALRRYRIELVDEEERCELWSRITRLRYQLGISG
jgi:hypothetical protein